MYEFLNPYGRYNDPEIVTWNGIITTYGVIKYLAAEDKVLWATEDEVKLYNERR